MGSIRRAPRTGRWEARYRDPAGKQRTQTFDRRAAAQAFLSRVDVAVQRGEWRDPQLGRTLLSDWIDEWWATTTNLRPSSRARDESYIRNHVISTFGDVPLGRLSQLDVRAWVADLVASGLAPATVHKAYQTLSKIMEAAVDSELITSSPCRKVPLPRIEREEMRFLGPDEIATLAEAIEPRFRAFVLLKAYGGLRLSEMAGLRRSRVDQLRSTVRIAEQIVEVRGHLHHGAPKTRAGHRTVAPRQVMSELVSHIGQFSEPGKDGLVFVGREGGALRAGLWRQRHWRPAVLAAGLTPLRPHDLRHTAVSLWAAAGASPNEVAARAGHASVTVVLDRYRHLFPDELERTTTRLGMFVEHGAPTPAVARLSP